ncbi:MAG: 16S rRNA processing protein RimM [Firmicutes bacterium]|jgi:16S rRNA processing protein RimM|nr:16S rRNA processing protein RimM [Bacillota bacterium]
MGQFRGSEKPGDFIAVGRVTTFQGKRGEVRVLPFTDFPDQFLPGSRLRATKKGRTEVLEIEGVRRHKKFIILKFAGIHSIDDAELLRGAVLEVPKSELLPLPEGHYYVFEIEGLKVVTTDGRYIGKVVRVISGNANDVYEVAPELSGASRKKSILIPAVKEMVKEINLELGTMIVDLIPGLE